MNRTLPWKSHCLQLLNLFTVGIIIIIGEGGEKSASGVVEEFSKDHYVSDDILFLLFCAVFGGGVL
jgi:hypothetical protein